MNHSDTLHHGLVATMLEAPSAPVGELTGAPAAVAPPESRDGSAAVSGTPAVRVLLVEDNELNRDMLSRRLAKKGYSVDIAVDGAQGIEMAISTRPDLILMDMSLPVIDGWEAVRTLKANDLVRGIPIIALTAHAMSDDRAKALDAGCDEYDTKPVELTRLLKKMESVLRTTTVA
jgi:CheY-like chemotaxis protein